VSAQPSATLNRRQRRLVEVVAAGSSLPEAAEVVGIHRVTAWRWLQRPDMAQAVAHAEDDIRAQARRRARMAAAEAVDVLRAVMRDEEATRSERTAASRALTALFAQLEPRQLDAAVAVTAGQLEPPGERVADYFARIARNYDMTDHLFAPANGGGDR
jgi:hypothetical protein